MPLVLQEPVNKVRVRRDVGSWWNLLGRTVLWNGFDCLSGGVLSDSMCRDDRQEEERNNQRSDTHIYS